MIILCIRISHKDVHREVSTLYHFCVYNHFKTINYLLCKCKVYTCTDIVYQFIHMWQYLLPITIVYTVRDATIAYIVS